MNKIKFFSQTGVKRSDINLPYVLKGKVNIALLSQALRVYNDNKHPITGRTKTRGEVIASTRKIYRQKGTGYARHGAKSAPIFVGGGIAHGPKGIKRVLYLPSKMRKKALSYALTLKSEEGDIVAIDNLSSFKKTKEISKTLNKIKNYLSKSNKNITFIVNKDFKNFKLLRNLEGASIKTFSNLNAYDVYYGGLIIFDNNIFENKVKRTGRKEKIVKNKIK